MLASVGGVFCYLVIVLRSSLEAQVGIGNGGGVNVSDHVAIEIDDHDANSEDNSHQELHSLRKRLDYIILWCFLSSQNYI